MGNKTYVSVKTECLIGVEDSLFEVESFAKNEIESPDGHHVSEEKTLDVFGRMKGILD